MRRFYLVIFFVIVFRCGLARATDLHLLNGDVVTGEEPASMTEDGIVMRLKVGGFSPRIGWGKLTQETLKELAKDPQAKKYAEPFIEIPIEVKQKEKAKKKEIVVRQAPVVERPAQKGLFAGLVGLPGILILVLLYVANLYAAFEVALFRQRPVALVCGMSAIMPIIGPLIFLAVPSAQPAEAPEEAAHPESAPPEAKKTGPTGAASNLGLAAHAGKETKDAAQPQVYKAAQHNFDRRFFETKFPGFFRVVPSEAEKDLVLVIKMPKAEYVAKRITRISSNEMHFNLLRGGTEATARFSEIMEVQVRHKDAK